MADLSIVVWMEGESLERWMGKKDRTQRENSEIMNSGFCHDLLGQTKHPVYLNSGMRSAIVVHGETASTIFFDYFSPFGIELVPLLPVQVLSATRSGGEREREGERERFECVGWVGG
ncbi:hypothetical protein AAG906_032795 [Vitis piasezkii]